MKYIYNFLFSVSVNRTSKPEPCNCPGAERGELGDVILFTSLYSVFTALPYCVYTSIHMHVYVRMYACAYKYYMFVVVCVHMFGTCMHVYIVHTCGCFLVCLDD